MTDMRDRLLFICKRPFICLANRMPFAFLLLIELQIYDKKFNKMCISPRLEKMS